MPGMRHLEQQDFKFFEWVSHAERPHTMSSLPQELLGVHSGTAVTGSMLILPDGTVAWLTLECSACCSTSPLVGEGP